MITVGIVGLGLIGGSLAKAYSESGEARVLACEKDRSVLGFSQVCGAVAGELTKENIGECDIVLVAIYPKAAIEYIRDMAPHFAKHTVVVDCCGTKREVCEACFPMAKEHGFTFVGGHPMAGKQYSGFKYAKGNLFHNAPMVIVPPTFDDIRLLARVKELLAPVGFGRISVTTADAHDEMIAFTSQLAHVVSNAYIKSPTASAHKGFSAGSYKDMTRVAWLNPQMWAELCLDNKDNLIREIDGLVNCLTAYREAMAADDRAELERLLQEGKERKEEVDGR